MVLDTRKINLIELILKESNESTINEIETIIKKSSTKPKKKIVSADQFSGLWSKKDAVLIEKAIEEGYEQINEFFF